MLQTMEKKTSAISIGKGGTSVNVILGIQSCMNEILMAKKKKKKIIYRSTCGQDLNMWTTMETAREIQG